MKIVQINSECGRGSTGRIALSISNLLTQRGIENYIFYSGNHISDYEFGIQVNSKFDLRCHQVLSCFFGNQGWHSYFATKKLIRKLEDIKPNVIHLHNIHGYYLHVPTLFNYLKKQKIRVVWTLHDCWPITGHCTHFINNGCNKWKTECKQCANKREYPYSWFFDRSRELYRQKKELFTGFKDMIVVTPSHWLANIVAESFLKDCKLEVLPNGINLSVFHPIEDNLRTQFHCEGKKIILGVSAVWNVSKGLDIFCELANRLDDSYQIILVGTTDKVDAKLPKNIISIHRTQNQEELVKIFSMADLFLNPTRADNYPTVNLESIACGTPVMTFQTGGSPESAGMDNSMIIKSNTIEETMAKIGSHDFSKKDSARCNELRKLFDERLCYEKYLELYQR